jgi:hypothetical protein
VGFTPYHGIRHSGFLPCSRQQQHQGHNSTPSPSPLSQQRCKAQFLISPIISPAPDAPPSPNSGQRTGHHDVVVSYLGRLQIESTIIQGGDAHPPPLVQQVGTSVLSLPHLKRSSLSLLKWNGRTPLINAPSSLLFVIIMAF